MFTISPTNGFEKHLCDKAFASETPLSGTFELLPVCNMDCRMCYIRMSREEMRRTGALLSVDEWFRIGKEAASKGCMFLLLTGGEPLLYPGFVTLYEKLRDLGIVVTVNTNGTLIDDKIAEVFQHNRPRRVNVSLYGASDEVYAELCRNPQGFSQAMRGIRLLLDKGIRVKVNFTPTPQNCNELEAVVKMTEQLGIPISTPTYMFPPVRKPDGMNVHKMSRLTPVQAAQVQADVFYMACHDSSDYAEQIEAVLSDMNPEKRDADAEPPGGLLCTAGVSSFWVNWRGGLTPCGMLQNPIKSLKECSFDRAWNFLRQETKKISTAKKCFNCRFRAVCKSCGAASYAENRDFSSPSRYHCELNAAYERILKKQLADLKNRY